MAAAAHGGRLIFSSSSRSSGAALLADVKSEPVEVPEHRCNRGGSIVTNEPPPPPPPRRLHQVKPKREPATLATPVIFVKKEHKAMAVADETTLKWAWDDYLRKEMKRKAAPWRR